MFSQFFEKYQKYSLIVSALMFLLALFLIFRPLESLNTFIMLFAIIILVNGIIKLVQYFRTDTQMRMMNFGLAEGILSIIAALIIMITSDGLIAFVPIMFSIWIMIQSIITRMGNNSFALKGWAVGIMIAVYAFAGNSNVKAVIVTLMPLIVFWFIDTYYLMLERKFRCLYDDVRIKDEQDIDFSMNPNDVKINLDEVKKYGFFSIFFSKSVLPFYLVCIATTLVIYFVKF